MNKWLNEIQLEGKLVTLTPLQMTHSRALGNAVSDGNIWELWYTSAPRVEDVHNYIYQARKEFENDISLPFAVVNHKTNKIVGTTRFMNADSKNKRIEIGTTWYAKSAQKTGINTECKYLLLCYAFETLNCIAVEFRTHIRNTVSRKSIARLGAKQDGVLRNHSIDKNGNLRDSVVYSIINSEWVTVKKLLEDKMNKKHST